MHANEARYYIISLKDSTERRRKSADKLSRLGVHFEFLDAVDGRKGDHPLLARFNKSKFLSRHGRPSVPGEAGCYASHYLLWQKCVELNRPIVILEDDFELAENAREAFEVAAHLADDFGYIRLESTRRKPSITRWRQGGYKLVRFMKTPQCMTCYQLSPDAARALIRASDEFVYPVDVFVRNQHLHGVPIYGLTPPPIKRAAKDEDDSIIGDRHQEKGPLWCKLTRMLFRSYNSIRNLLSNIRLLLLIDLPGKLRR